MGKKVHKLLSVNEKTRTAICAHCGHVTVRRKSAASGPGWRCNNGNPGTRKGGIYKSYLFLKKGICENKLCSYTEIHNCMLDVHHKDGDPKNNSEDNLITLCSNCHRLAHAGLLFL